MLDRLIQLLTRYIALGLFTVSGWLLGTAPTDEVTGEIEGIASAIAAAVVAAIMLLGDLLVHRLRHGGFLKDNGKPVAKAIAKAPAILLCAMLSVGVVATASVPGCAQTQPVQYEPGPGTDYIYASNTVRDVVVLLRAALADGLINADDWRDTVNPAIQETNTALNAWEAAVLSGRADEIGTARVLAESLIARLRDHLATASLGGDS